jgi:hypothetical protein
MRNKIIAVNAVIVLIVGLLAFAIVKTQLSAATSSTEQLKKSAQEDALGIAARLQLDGLRAERWLATKAAEPGVKANLGKATPDARADAARQISEQLANQATSSLGLKPAIVAVIDSNGKQLGRNGTDVGRGDDLAALYPSFKEALAKAAPGSDVWVDPKRGDQYVASYTPVRDDSGRVMMLVFGASLNDALTRATAGAYAASNTGRGVLLVNANGDVLANTQTTDDIKKAVKDGTADVKNALQTGTAVGGGSGNVFFAAAPLDGFGLKQTAVVAVAPTSLLEGVNGVPYSILGAMVLGLILVVAAGWFLGSYISRPIAMLEEGLLAILNGQSDKRFELDHAELGGLAFRIDQLLNQLMGVEEDNTDEEGRVSKAPMPTAGGLDPSYIGGLPSSNPGVSEPADQYYARLYNEYITAKRGLGEQVDQITPDVFKQRIQSMEQDMLQKHGKPVRYQVQVNGREVQLLAVTT